MPKGKYTAEFKTMVILIIIQGGTGNSMPFALTST